MGGGGTPVIPWVGSGRTPPPSGGGDEKKPDLHAEDRRDRGPWPRSPPAAALRGAGVRREPPPGVRGGGSPAGLRQVRCPPRSHGPPSPPGSFLHCRWPPLTRWFSPPVSEREGARPLPVSVPLPPPRSGGSVRRIELLKGPESMSAFITFRDPAAAASVVAEMRAGTAEACPINYRVGDVHRGHTFAINPSHAPQRGFSRVQRHPYTASQKTPFRFICYQTLYTNTISMPIPN